MKEKIKSKVKKVVLPIFISVLSGGICGHLVYNIYEDEASLAQADNLVYLIQSGAYSSYDNMRANTMGNYVYYEDEGLYKTIIGITQSEENIEKIKDAYGKEVVVNKYYINDKELCNSIKEYDQKLNKVQTNEEVQQVVIEMLNLYKEDKNVEISKVS